MAKVEGSVVSRMKDLGYKAIVSETKLLHKSSVAVGFPDSGKRNAEGTLTVAQQAIIHELGAPSQGIPSRPANRMAYEQNFQAVVRRCKSLDSQVKRGRSAEKALARLGVWYEALLKLAYRKGPFRPLKASTVANRKHGGSVPLHDTHTMVNSITSKVEMGRRI